MLDSRFNCIAIFDAIPEGQLRTGIHLRGELEDIANYRMEGLTVRYYSIHTIGHMLEALNELRTEALENNLLPWIHIDAHGLDDESGFCTSDGNHVSWEQFKKLITPINVATELNLVVVFASCYGASFASSIRATDRAPVLALFGPMHEVTAGAVDADFPAFYRAFTEELSLGRALAALMQRTEVDLYYGTTAEMFFFDMWKAYKQNCCTRTAMRKRVKKIRKGLIRGQRVPVPSVKSALKVMKDEEPNLFAEYRDTYFMNDLYPNNRERFDVSYTGAEEYAAH